MNDLGFSKASTHFGSGRYLAALLSLLSCPGRDPNVLFNMQNTFHKKDQTILFLDGLMIDSCFF